VGDFVSGHRNDRIFYEANQEILTNVPNNTAGKINIDLETSFEQIGWNKSVDEHSVSLRHM